jgi:hypothetical protein
MVVALAVLCSPLAWTYFYCWLMPAWAAAAACLVERRAGRAVVVGFVLAAVLAAAALTEQIDPLLQAYGVTTAAAAVLFLSLGWVRLTERAAVAGPVVFSGRVTLPDAAGSRPLQLEEVGRVAPVVAAEPGDRP